jgi:hypothetical protein
MDRMLWFRHMLMKLELWWQVLNLKDSSDCCHLVDCSHACWKDEQYGLAGKPE